MENSSNENSDSTVTRVRCIDCGKVLSEVNDLKVLVSTWFDILSLRLDDHNEKLSTVVKAVTSTSCDKFHVQVDNNDNREQNPTPDYDENSEKSDDGFLSFSTRNQRSAEPAVEAIEEEEEEEDDVDVKPDLYALKKSILAKEKEDVAVSDNSSFNITESVTAVAVDVKPISNSSLIQQALETTSSSSSRPLIGGSEPKKQFILVRNNGNLNIISGAVNRQAMGVSSFTEPKRNDSTDTSTSTFRAGVSSTPLGTTFRKPVSEEAKRRLAVSRPKMFASPCRHSLTAAPLSASAQQRLYSSAMQKSGVAERDIERAKRRLSRSVEKMEKKTKIERSDNRSSDSESTNSGVNETVQRTSSKKEKTCPVCSKELSSHRSLQRHMRTHSGYPLAEIDNCCRDCGKTFCNEESLAKHMKYAHNMFWGRCQYCNEVVNDRSKLLEHEKEHNVNGDRFACALCPNAYNRICNLNRHMRQRHGQDVAVVSTDGQ